LLFYQIYILRFLESLEKSMHTHNYFQLDPFSLSGLFVSFDMSMRTKQVWKTFLCRRGRNIIFILF